MNRVRIKIIISAIPTVNQIIDAPNSFGKNKMINGNTINPLMKFIIVASLHFL